MAMAEYGRRSSDGSFITLKESHFCLIPFQTFMHRLPDVTKSPAPSRAPFQSQLMYHPPLKKHHLNGAGTLLPKEARTCLNLHLQKNYASHNSSHSTSSSFIHHFSTKTCCCRKRLEHRERARLDGLQRRPMPLNYW
jgi:hypothetical protein